MYLEERNLISLCWGGERRNKEVKREIGFGFLCPSFSLFLRAFLPFSVMGKQKQVWEIEVRVCAKEEKNRRGRGKLPHIHLRHSVLLN